MTIGFSPQHSDHAPGSPVQAQSGPFPRLPVTISPERQLLTYYTLTSLLLGPAFLFMLVPLYFRYRTMRYEVDAEGITMRWGILFRREVSLTYARIQDIHLSSNFVERWLGLAKIQIQTASGSAKAEMIVEGVSEPDSIRDFLYSRMRGARNHTIGTPESGRFVSKQHPDELAATLREVAAEIRNLRYALTESRTTEGTDA